MACTLQQWVELSEGRCYNARTDPVTISGERRDLAMTCGRFGRYANKTNLLSDHGRFLLSDAEAAAIFDHITTTVRNEWRPTLRRAGVSETDCEAIKSAFVYDPTYIPHFSNTLYRQFPFGIYFEITSSWHLSPDPDREAL